MTLLLSCQAKSLFIGYKVDVRPGKYLADHFAKVCAKLSPATKGTNKG